MRILESPEQRVLLRNIGWDTYERLLEDHGNSSAPRFTYDRGMLEIMSPHTEHEEYNRTIASLVEILLEERDADFRNVGSMTFKREDLERGFEPDSCFYIQNEERVRGKTRIDAATDPPPDLVIEIDITSISLNKFPIYAQLGVPEVWRYDGERLAILRLVGAKYGEAAGSEALPSLPGAVISRFVEQSKSIRRTVWMRRVRQWAREHDTGG